MAGSFTLPLRPLLDERDRPDTLPAEIAQINNQWGSFRDVNEDVLRTKIAEEYKDDLDENEGDQSASDLDSTELHIFLCGVLCGLYSVHFLTL